MAATALIDQLNEQQREIVFAPMEDSLVVAGAGTGKTRVLIARLAYLLEVEGLEPYQIMAMTFTNKAANEMNERLAAAMGWDDNKSMWVGTFHGLCFRLLRQYALEAMLPRNFTLLTPSDQESLVRTFYANHGIKPKSDEYLGALKDHDLDPKSVITRIMRLKDRGVRPQLSDEQAQHYVQNLQAEWPKLSQQPDDAIFEVIFACYERLRQNSGAVDFADLIVYAVHLLESNAQVRAHMQRRFRYICVDEFQDTNEMQLKFLLLLKSQHNNVFVVGDDDQAIYGWRGAQAANLNKLAAALPQMKVYELSINYRSGQDILTFANAVILGCTNRLTAKFLLNPYTFELWRQEDLMFLRKLAAVPEAQEHFLTLLDGRKLEDLSYLERNQLINTLIKDGTFAPELAGWRKARRWYIFPGMAPYCDLSGAPKLSRTYGLTTRNARMRLLSWPQELDTDLLRADPEAVGAQYAKWQDELLFKAQKSFVNTELVRKPVASGAVDNKIVMSKERLDKFTDEMIKLRTQCAKMAGAAECEEVPHNQVHLLQVQDKRFYGNGEDDGLTVLEIIERLQASGYRHEDIAVLYRNNSLSLQVERALAQHNIPYQVYGGIKFYERAEILSAMAYCRVLLNPKDDVSFTRAINEPKRGMGKVALNKLSAFAQQCGLSLYEAIDHIVKTQDKQGLKLIKKCQGFYEQMEEFKRKLPTMSLGDFLAMVITDSGLIAFYEEVDRKDKAERRGTSRVDNLQQLVVNAREYEALQVATQSGDIATINNVVAQQHARRRQEHSAEDQERLVRSNLASLIISQEQLPKGEAKATALAGAPEHFCENLFVNFVASSTLAASTERTADGRERDKGVQLMTIHASKGLEFPAVILVGVEDGILPSRRSEDENEERRLLYVALTRAKKCLFVTYNITRMTYQGLESAYPSPFLVEAVELFEERGLHLGDAKLPYCFSTLQELLAQPTELKVALGACQHKSCAKLTDNTQKQWEEFHKLKSTPAFSFW